MDHALRSSARPQRLLELGLFPFPGKEEAGFRIAAENKESRL